MKIFISYKSEDIEKVQEITEKILNISPDIQISTMRQTKRWKSLAKKLISKADKILYLAGAKYSDNIDWEINYALKIGFKVYCVKLDDNIILSNKLHKNNGFETKEPELKIEKPISLDKLLSILGGDKIELRDKLFNSRVENDSMLIEQYKLLLGTTESLIERRQKLTTTYISIFSIILPVISTMLSFPQTFLKVATMIISLVCIVLCCSWRKTIISYGKSNRAKFAILEEMEHKLPVDMFASEWFALKNLTTKYKSFTSRETIIPIIFSLIYALFFIIAIVMLFVK